MRYYVEGYLEESKQGERYLREEEHNKWHDDIEAAITEHVSTQVLGLLLVYFSHLHDDNIPPKHAEDYL